MKYLTNKQFGSRFGKKVRSQHIKYYNSAHDYYLCKYCNYLKPTVKKYAVGIWFCKFCKIKFAGPAYNPYKV